MQKGFTFVELLLTVLILGGLLVFLLPRYTQAVKQQHQTHMKVLNDARNLQKQLDARQQYQERQLDQLTRPAQPPRRSK